MRNQKDEAAKLDEQKSKAEQKIKSQDEVVRRLNGTADEHPDEKYLLSEVRQNKAAIDLNRALLDYDEEKDDPK